MKYGISSVSDENTLDKRNVSENNSVASGSEAAMASPRHGGDADAVIFSIQFYGKTIGEVGMMDQDLSELDWKKFKSYLFQNLLSVNHQENICVSYSDEEGDKLPIESDEEYQEALKVAKKKAEMHDKLVLDLTRQGGFPAMLSLVSSGIKKVSSSPPKEGGISFFKASSPPKDGAGFKAVGTERRLFPGFFMPDKGPIPGHVQGVWGYDCDEALECGKVNTTSATTTTTTTTTSVPTARTDCKRGPPVRALRNSPPNLLFKFEAPTHNLKSTTSACQDVFGAGNGGSTGARPKDLRIEREFSEQPPEWFTSYMGKFRAEVCEEVSQRVTAKVEELLRTKNVITSSPLEEPQIARKFVKPTELKTVESEERPLRNSVGLKKSLDSDEQKDSARNSEKKKKKENEPVKSTVNPESIKPKKKDEKTPGVKRKKLVKEEERLLKKQEKIERKKSVLTSKYADEMDKASRTQEKVFAKMEGLRKKQFCSQEELSKLRKMVDKQHRFITAEQRQQRRNERKAGYQKMGKCKKISIDNKGFPVDASLLHAALQELEVLAEDSASDTTGAATTRGYDALYLNDITFPDGSAVAPGTEFVKTWRVVNNGVIPWNEKTTLCKWSQVRFRGSPAGWKLKPSMKRVVCPPLEPGQEGDISITFTAPSEPGWYATHWRFCQRGRVFGNQMWCAIHVKDEAASYEPQIPLPGDPNYVPIRGLPVIEMPNLEPPIILQEEVVDPVFEKYTRLGLEPHEELIIPPREELGPQNDLGIVENYYDAEDPVQRDCTESLQQLTLSCPDEPSEVTDGRKDRDLISFEEEAEVIDSGNSTPEIISSLPQAHSVVPLKEMAKESVESLIIKEQGMKSQLQPTSFSSPEDLIQSDSISMSSGSFSELDSEDQAILNESDSEGSDHEYYVVHLPECFNMSSLHNGLPEMSESSAQESTVVGCVDIERPDSPDFLTADEDDRTTAVASDSSDDLTCPLNEHDYASKSSSASQASSRLSQVNDKCQKQVQNILSTRSSMEHDDEGGSAVASTLPDPPTDTRPFMSIPNEAIQTNVVFTTAQMPSSGSEQGSQSHKEQQDLGTWTTGTDNAQNVVCQQPYSAQHKESKQDAVSQGGVSSESGNQSNTSATSPQLPVDLVGALPDELVSIIPEDLVRGAWNTARSFITRINQEMLSPTSDTPGRVYKCEEDSSCDQQPPPPPQSPPSTTASAPLPEETTQQTVTTTERESTSPLPPPMQQLEDMGFHNREVNDRLLTKYNGDVSCAVAELIILDCH